MVVSLNIPDDGGILVKKGQLVNYSTPLWEKVSEETIEIDIAKKLAIKPEKIFDYLKKFIGDQVKKDEVIAEKKGFLFNKEILSPKEGEIKEINHESGVVIISSLTQKEIIYSFFKGEIINIEKSLLKVKVDNGHPYSIKKTDKELGGDVYYYQPNNFLTASDVEEKIVIFNEIDPIQQIKIEALGAKAFIGAKMISETTHLPFFQLKNQKDIEKIFQFKKSACLIVKNESKIIFYD